MEKSDISIAIIAKNEADRIGRLLQSCAFANEIVVVDSGSSDGTQAICERAGARVITNAWPGYVAQKQFALEATSSAWILSLDADEEVPPALATEIAAAVGKAGEEIGGFSMPRLSRYLGRWIRHGGWYPDRKVRLVRKGRGTWGGEDPHDKLFAAGEIGRLQNPILHHVYRGIADQVATINNFSAIYAKQGTPKGGWFVAVGVLHGLGKFCECYLLKRGLLDGIPGLVIAMNSAWYVFLKHAKRWEAGLPGKDRDQAAPLP